MIKSLDDVIAAIATPIGEGGISIIRLSGRNAIEIADRGFRGKQSLASVPTHTVHFGSYIDGNGNILDEVLVTVFIAPHSYTAENSVEISCHGGMFTTGKILDSVIANGARIAEPGEFTKRAFFNGRIDLSQAEAVADLIHSQSERSHRASLAQLQGSLSKRVQTLQDALLSNCSLLELELDFAEEGLEYTDKGKIAKDIERVVSSLTDLINSFNVGKLYREGMKVVIAGKPNVGKSSLLNLLLKQNRAIVTDIPGTTRDTIEESVIIDGLLVKLVDTAGLGESGDLAEFEGVKRAIEQVENADLVLFLIDISKEIGHADEDAMIQISGRASVHLPKKSIIIFNKIDLFSDYKQIAIPSLYANLNKLFVSAKTGVGIESLRRYILDYAFRNYQCSPESGVIVTNKRHKDCLSKAHSSLFFALEELAKKRSNELISVHLHSAMNSLGEIVGFVTNDDILNNIFLKFCIGK
jgi:tRNA modification GTPase